MVTRFELYEDKKFTGEIIKASDKREGYAKAREKGYKGELKLKPLKKKPARPNK